MSGSDRDRGGPRGFNDWDRERISALERKTNEIERPMREALGEIRAWQAGAIEREKRREEQINQLMHQVTDLRKQMEKDLDGIKNSIPNKAINDLIVKVVLGLIGMILIAVVSLWLGVLGVKQ